MKQFESLALTFLALIFWSPARVISELDQVKTSLLYLLSFNNNELNVCYDGSDMLRIVVRSQV